MTWCVLCMYRHGYSVCSKGRIEWKIWLYITFTTLMAVREPAQSMLLTLSAACYCQVHESVADVLMGGLPELVHRYSSRPNTAEYPLFFYLQKLLAKLFLNWHGYSWFISNIISRYMVLSSWSPQVSTNAYGFFFYMWSSEEENPRWFPDRFHFQQPDSSFNSPRGLGVISDRSPHVTPSAPVFWTQFSQWS